MRLRGSCPKCGKQRRLLAAPGVPRGSALSAPGRAGPQTSSASLGGLQDQTGWEGDRCGLPWASNVRCNCPQKAWLPSTGTPVPLRRPTLGQEGASPQPSRARSCVRCPKSGPGVGGTGRAAGGLSKPAAACLPGGERLLPAAGLALWPRPRGRGEPDGVAQGRLHQLPAGQASCRHHQRSQSRLQPGTWKGCPLSLGCPLTLPRPVGFQASPCLPCDGLAQGWQPFGSPDALDCNSPNS